ncbi:hypothetical protein BX666DRAFT_2023358 [Dichotomocladium elegans]|nr:hypothetical protein BX666DRAFT_2023358 [Dichotomocladium elegans]
MATNQSSPFPTLITVHDAVTDSPIFRANVVHWDEQLDLFEKWLLALSTHIKHYTEKLNRFNSDTLVICEKARPPPTLDGGLIALPLTSTAFNRLTMTLQSTIVVQMQLVLELQNDFVEPLYQYVKNYLKDFREFRKQHDRALERYESQLQKYASLAKSKDPSIRREEAVRLHDTRKTYVHLSGQHSMRIVNFRGLLSNLMVERLSKRMESKDAFDELSHAWKDLNSSIGRWKQWLVDDQQTCIYELRKLQQVRERLESEYLHLMQPRKDLSSYMSSALPINGAKSPSFPAKPKVLPFSKWGYLFCRVSRLGWNRRWCFIYNEHFGWCTVSSKSARAMVTVEEKVSVASCEVRLITDSDRRFCFEVTIRPSQTTYILQAETDEELRDWLSCFEGAKQLSIRHRHTHSLHQHRASDTSIHHHRASIDNQSIIESFPSTAPSSSSSFTPGSPTTRVNPKAKSTTVLTAPKDIPVTLSGSAPLCHLSMIASPDDISGLVSKPMHHSQWSSDGKPALVLYNSNSLSNYDGMSLITCLSLSPVLVWEAASMRSISSVYVPSSLWGVPWPILGTTLLGERTNVKPSNIGIEKSAVMWPLADDSSCNISVNLQDYNYQQDNMLIRQLFGSVSKDEVVLDVFIGLLRKKNRDIIENLNTFDSVSLDSFDQELNSQLCLLNTSPPSDFGYGYAGKAFITQHTLWFYSFSVIAFVNTVAVRLTSIKDIRVVTDHSTISSRDHALIIDVETNESDPVPIILSIADEDINTVAERLRFIVQNAKSGMSLPLDELYSKMTSISQKHRHRASSLLPPETPNGPLEGKKKKKRLSFRSLGSNRPVINTGRRSTELANNYNAAERLAMILPQTPRSSSGIINEYKPETSPVTTTVDMPALATPTRIEEDDNEDFPPPEPVDPDQLPPDIVAPDGPVGCLCSEHMDKMVTEMEFPISAKRLFDLMFSDEYNATPETDGGVWAGKTAGTEGHDLRVTKWETTNGKTTRLLKYIMPVSNPIVFMKEAEVVETQVLLTKEDYIRYIVQISTRTAALPFADAFIPSVRYCITWLDKSRCKLTCCMGVKWVKTVIARAIVTRAALKGMGDSIQVFAPVLEEAATKIAEKVLAEKQANVQDVPPKSLSLKPKRPERRDSGITAQQPESYNDASACNTKEDADKMIVQGNTTLEDHQEKPAIIDAVAAVPSTNANRMNAISSQQQSPSTSGATITTTSSAPEHAKTDTSRAVPTSPTRTRVTTRANMSVSQTPLKRAKSGTSIYQRIKPHRLVFLLMIFWLLATTISRVWKWVHYPSPDQLAIIEEANEKTDASSHMFDDSSAAITYERKVVYLREIENGMIHSTLEPPYVHSESFKSFVTSTRKHANDNSTSSHLGPYTWASTQYYKAALDIDLSRERLAGLRHDLLMIFKTLNRIDLDLRESEYINWLLDSRIRCHRAEEVSTPTSGDTDEGHKDDLPGCYEIIYQLDTFFFNTHTSFTSY